MITNQLKDLREQQKSKASNPNEWTQEALGKRVGVTRQTIIAIERGKYNPTLELAFRLACEFSVSIEDMFNYRSEENEA
ncbi:MAG: helix-turn-helix transcriptional regulator [Candidatus Thorarchaeota archaeon]|nr:helix-turn-helix transcriptional regulator [Candidatus Thorarchaeota archaeon]